MTGAALAFLTVFFVGVIACGPLLMFLIGRRLPWGISRRLLRGAGPITIRTRYSGGTWNPAKPLGPGNSTPNEPGWATYTLTADGMVQLSLVRRDGTTAQFVGPPVETPDHYRRTRRLGVVPSIAYAIALAAGFFIGYAVSNGSEGDRSGIGFVVALVALVVVWLGLTIVGAAWRRRVSQRAR